MIAAPRTTVQTSGVKWTVEAVDSAEALLEGDIFLWSRAQRRQRAGEPREEDIRAVLEWLVEHIVDIEVLEGFAPDWSSATHEERVSFADSRLGFREIRALKEEIIDCSSLAHGLVEQIVDVYDAAASDGCDCAVCTGRLEDTREHRETYCKYGQVDDAADRVVNATHALLDDVGPQAPYWLYQIKRARETGQARARQRERQQEDRKQETRSELKRRGLL